MTESWLPIEFYEGIYEVSSIGQVRSLTRVATKTGNKGTSYTYTITGRILKPKLTRAGYYEYKLSNGKKHDLSDYRANRLVAAAFIPNPTNLPVVHHINHNKLDNRVENLKWVTHQGNIQAEIDAGHKWGNFKIGVDHHNARYTDEFVFRMVELENAGFRRSEIATMLGCNRPYVTNILKNKVRSCIKNI
jgi:hypothetical protein